MNFTLALEWCNYGPFVGPMSIRRAMDGVIMQYSWWNDK